MTRKGIVQVTAGVIVVVLTTVGTVSAAAAALVADPDAAATIIEDDSSVSFNKQERKCLVSALRAKPAITRAVVDADGLDSVETGKQGVVFGMMARCAPEAVARELDFAPQLFGGGDVPPDEIRCFFMNIGNLDDDVLATAASEGDFDSLPADQQQQVLTFVFDCLPTVVGRGMVKEFTKGLGTGSADVKDRQAKCVGDGVGDALSGTDLSVIVSADDPPPAFTRALLGTMADCTPDVLVAAFTKSFHQSGASTKVAKCVAKGVVADADLLGDIVDAGANGGTTPPALQELISDCS